MRIRILAPLAALVVVLGLMGVIFALHAGAGNTRAAGVTAATPPDAVHVVVAHSQSYSTVPDPNNANCPAGSTCYTQVMAPSSATVYDQTITDATTAQRLQSDLNAPPVAGALLPGATHSCGSELLTYDFTFTAGGQTVEHVVMRITCDGIGLRAGYAPDLTLGTEQANAYDSSMLDVLKLTYGQIPHDQGSNLIGAGAPAPTAAAAP